VITLKEVIAFIERYQTRFLNGSMGAAKETDYLRRISIFDSALSEEHGIAEGELHRVEDPVIITLGPKAGAAFASLREWVEEVCREQAPRVR
jgi:hypothetical protein